MHPDRFDALASDLRATLDDMQRLAQAQRAYGIRPHARLTGHWVADALFAVSTFGQATVAADTIEDATDVFATEVDAGRFTWRPQEA